MIGVYNAMAKMIWTIYFIENQGYKIVHNRLMYDNKSAIFLEKNGKLSSSKRTKHIKTGYFFVTHRVEQGDLEIIHHPAERMWANILTKPPQFRAFREFRAELMK